MRNDGFYKVKHKGEWVLAEWVTNQDIDSSWSCWIIPGVTPPEGSWGFSDKDFEDIDESSRNKTKSLIELMAPYQDEIDFALRKINSIFNKIEEK